MTRTVVYFTDSDGFGGAEQALLHILAGLDRRRWRPVLFHHPERGLAPLLEGARGLDVELRAVPRMPLGGQGAARVPRFVGKLRAERPVVFHAHLTWPLACKYGLVAAILDRVPAIVATEQLFVELPYDRATRIQQRLIAAGVHRYIAVSHDMAQRLRQTFRIPAHKIKVVHNAIPLNRFKRPANATLRASLTGPTERPIVLAAARLDKQKGLDYLLKAAALVPEALFVLAGDGPERARLAAQAHELGLDDRVVFLGYRHDIPDLLASCDLFVLPSLFEGLPLSVLEAMAAGKPVIGTAIGGTDEAIAHGETGLLVPPADPGALAEALRTVLGDPALAQRLAAAGKARVHQEFSAETMVQRVTGIYDELLDTGEARQTVNGIDREEGRNRLLRRADWRFLLPNPRPTKSICFANNLLAQAVELISDRVADARHVQPGDCDLAVAADPDQDTLRAAWSALRPGGSCYTEWYSPLAGGPQGVRRRLEAIGFAEVSCYWPWPWPSRAPALFWLPLEAPGALRYFMTSRPPDRSVVRQVVRAILRAIWRLMLPLRLTLPICAITHKPARPGMHQAADTSPNRITADRSSRTRGLDANLLETIRDGWERWGCGPTPDRLSWLLLTGGQRSINKVVGLVFAGSDHRPRLAVKMARVPESVPDLAREATTLRAVQSLRPGVQGVPRVLFFHEHTGILGETFVSGQPLFTRLRRGNYRDVALKATAWLADLAGCPEPSPRSTWWDRLIEPVLADFSDSFGPILDAGMLRETRAILATLGDLPLVCEQRDFSPWNVLVTPTGELAVLDWESSEPQGLPAMDLIYFLTYLAFFLDGTMESGHFRESYRAALDASTLTGAVLSECLERYAIQADIDPANLRPLRLLAWLLHSRSEYRRFVADAAGRPARETLRRSLFVGLWEEEMRSMAVGTGLSVR